MVPATALRVGHPGASFRGGMSPGREIELANAVLPISCDGKLAGCGTAVAIAQTMVQGRGKPSPDGWPEGPVIPHLRGWPPRNAP